MRVHLPNTSGANLSRACAAAILSWATAALGDNPVTNNAPEMIGASSAELVKQATQDFADGKVDPAIREVSMAIQLDPHNVLAYDLRSSIYIQRKLWDRAERDVTAEDQISPDVAYKYKLGEIKFLQKAYDDARPRFAALQGNERLGDLATYKTFLCDLFGGHESIAAHDLAALESKEKKAPYYFCHAAWALYHGNRAEANQWFGQAHQHCDDLTAGLYIASLFEVQRIKFATATFATRDGRKFANAHIYLEISGLRASTPNGWVTLPLDQLPDDLTAFPEDVRDQIRQRRASASAEATPTSVVSFASKSGKSYDHVRWSLESDGLAVLTADGWITLPFEQLPIDLSAFPSDAQKAIAEKQKSLAESDTRDTVVSFTTKSGKTYDQIKATLRHDGLALLTNNGLVTVAFRDLPDDLSTFPADWRAQIEAGRNVDDSTDTQVVSFVTKTGTPYEDVRASLEPTGLRVLTSTGLVSIPFDQLGTDLAAFPEAWRTIIATRQHELQTTLPANSPHINATTDLYPPNARDCHFGSCVALEGALMVVGGNGAAYVYANERLMARLCPGTDSTSTGETITSVALSGQTIVTGTPHGVDVWVRLSHDWTLQATLSLPGPATTVSIDSDNLLAVVDGRGGAANLIFYFSRQGTSWKPVSRTSQPEKDTLSADHFGCIGGLLGSEALIGVPDWSKASYLKGNAAESGQAHLERYDGKTWNEEAVLTPDDAAIGANQFGGSVALSEDFAAISSTNHDTIDYTPHHGSVYLFRHSFDGWKKDAVLKSPDPAGDAGFGCAPVALSHETLAVGDADAKVRVDQVILDTGDKTKQAGTIKNAGAVYVFEGHDLRATLNASDPVESLDRLGSPDQFAASLALDGNTIVIGAPGKNGGAGVVYIWKRQKGQWQMETELKGFHQQADFNY